MIKQFLDSFKPMGRWDTTGVNNMSILEVTRQCTKCGAIVHSVKRNPGFCNGYYTTVDGPCPAGGNHDWTNITEEQWIDE